MRRLLLAVIVVVLFVSVGVGVFIYDATSQPDYSFCGACTTDSDCGVGFKCCPGDCPEGQMKCYQVDTCP
ncbi:MAG: hypothetical protein P9M14_09020 [Candidatus Alcyoniella australis]|nr:hypothetical protein [Candidatus Alcyoniella australis]